MSTSTRNVLFGQGDVNGIITPLIPFNCIYDIDTGLIRYMYENGYTANTDIIDPWLFSLLETDTRAMIANLYAREKENPLSLIIHDQDIDIDEMYNEFMQKHYENIIRSSYHTGLYEICTAFKGEKSITGSIIYSGEAEYYMLRDDPRLKGIYLVDLDELKDLDEYNIIFFKSLNDMYINLFAEKVQSKAVYIMDYRFNFKDDGSLVDSSAFSLLELQRNNINVINAFDRSRLGMEV